MRLDPWQVRFFVLALLAVAASPLDSLDAFLAGAGSYLVLIILPMALRDSRRVRVIRVSDPDGRIAEAVGVPPSPPGYTGELRLEILATRRRARETRRELRSLARGKG